MCGARCFGCVLTSVMRRIPYSVYHVPKSSELLFITIYQKFKAQLVHSGHFPPSVARSPRDQSHAGASTLRANNQERLQEWIIETLLISVDWYFHRTTITIYNPFILIAVIAQQLHIRCTIIICSMISHIIHIYTYSVKKKQPHVQKTRISRSLSHVKESHLPLFFSKKKHPSTSVMVENVRNTHGTMSGDSKVVPVPMIFVMSLRDVWAPLGSAWEDAQVHRWVLGNPKPKEKV